MPLMLWDNSLDIGVAAMNAEHRSILDAMNAIYDAHKAGTTGPAIDRLVARLGEVCVRHFADEERYMTKIGFPGLAGHKLIHTKLLKDFTVHAEAIKAAGGTANNAFFQFLQYWLSAHIRGIDAKYGVYSQQPAGATAGSA